MNPSTPTDPAAHSVREASDPTERLSADDMATLREAQFLAQALAQHSAHAGLVAPCGVCANCQAQCLPTAKYCDEDCRSDHEARLTRLRRQGRIR